MNPADILKAAGLPVPEAVEAYEYSAAQMSEYSRWREITGLADAALVALAEQAAELEARLDIAICVFCGATMKKDPQVMLEHATTCKNRPENRLMERIAELEAENENLRAKGTPGWARLRELEAELAATRTDRTDILDSAWNTANKRAEQAEADRKLLMARLQKSENETRRAEKKLDSMKIMERNADWKVRAERAEAEVEARWEVKA